MGSLDHAQKAANECPRIYALKTRKEPGVYLDFDRRILLVGFEADFWAWLADFGGVVRRRIFCFRLADFPADFFADFSLAFCDQKSTAKIHRKIHHSHGGLVEDFPQ